eukprot:COSAG01_NODE_34_length_34978_cov_45.798475_16_plen_187_part_00
MRAMGVGADHIDMMSQAKGAVPPADSPICSHMGLQMLLYYHVFFDLVWFGMYIALWSWKTDNLNYDHAFKLVSPTVFALWTIAEPPRILFGYIGNLKEKVPQMASFVLVTVILSLPCLAYFFFFEQNKLPLDWAMHGIQFSFTVAELVVGRYALTLLIRAQRDRFAVQAHVEGMFQVSPGGVKQQP